MSKHKKHIIIVNNFDGESLTETRVFINWHALKFSKIMR